MASDSHHDVVIVGGGHNGLVAAAYLARAGRSVLVLERRDHVGGAAVSERPWPGVDARLSRYAYLVSLLPQSIVDELGLRIRLGRRRISSYTPLPADPSRGLLVDAEDRERTAASLHAATGDPAAIEGWEQLYATCAVAARALFPTHDRAAAPGERAARAGGRRRGVGGAVRAPDRRAHRGLPRRRRRARGRAHRRAHRDLRRRPRRRSAPEPLLPLPRHRQRHRPLGRPHGRDGRGHRRARGGGARRGRAAALRRRGHGDRTGPDGVAVRFADAGGGEHVAAAGHVLGNVAPAVLDAPARAGPPRRRRPRARS